MIKIVGLTYIFVIPEIITSAKSMNTQTDETTFMPVKIINGTVYNSSSNIHWPLTAGVVIVIVFFSMYVLFR